MNLMLEQTLQNNLSLIRHRIEKAAIQSRRLPETIKLVAVSKFHPIESIQVALKAGQRIFGENRVQEAKEKFSILREAWPDLKLHIIGTLQTNKVIDAVKIADTIETLDRPKLIDALNHAADKVGYLPNLLVQVNTGNEPQKSGISTKEADAFIDLCCQRFGSNIKGVMGIPPANEDPIPHFQFLSDLGKRHGLPEISMGMSADFEQAIASGATLVRVGSAIFGPRPISKPIS